MPWAGDRSWQDQDPADVPPYHAVRAGDHHAEREASQEMSENAKTFLNEF